jgi:DNA-binding transcriptional LysR family regulator
LERRFDVTLLERQGRTWRPTDDGEALLDAISEILHSVDGLEDRFRRLRNDLPRTLTVVASPGAVLSELNRPVVEFRKRRPNCRICITISAGMEQTTEQLLTGTVDFAIVPQSIAGQIPLRRSLTRSVIYSRPSVVAVGADHPLARKRVLRLVDLVGVPLILPSPEHVWRQRVDEVFREAGLLEDLNVILETSLNQAMRRWVHQGLGVAAFPKTNDGIEYPGLVLRPADQLFPSEDVVCIRRVGKARPEVELFERLLAKVTK